MTNILNFPTHADNTKFDTFLRDNNEDPELPLLVYDHLCQLTDTPRHELCCITLETYNKIRGAVNGLMDRAVQQGVITNLHRLTDDRMVA
jgi:hypothetical protein